MEKIYFDETTYIWKTKLNRVLDKSILLNESKLVIESASKNRTDGFGYTLEWNGNINFDGGIDIKTKFNIIWKRYILMKPHIFGKPN